MSTTTTIDSKHTSRSGRRLRRPLRAALTLGLAVVGVSVLGCLEASAQTWSQTGSPGQVAATAYATANGSTRQITVNPSVIGKSPQYGGYDQYVCITSRLWQITGSQWQQVNSNRRCGWIRGTSSSLTDWGNSFPAGYAKGYSVTVDYTWQLSNGATLGTKRIGFSAAKDYWCTGGNCMIGNTIWGGGAFVFFPNY